MPSDKHNSKMAWARYLIFSLINVASSRDMLFHFHQLQQLQCLHHGATFVPLCTPILSSWSCKVTICWRHMMASVRDIKIAEALLILCLAYYVWNKFDIAEIEALWLSHVKIWGARFMSIFSVFSVMARWIAEMRSLLILLCNEQNIAEYEAYWWSEDILVGS